MKLAGMSSREAERSLQTCLVEKLPEVSRQPGQD
jgi:hypothetical protein